MSGIVGGVYLSSVKDKMNFDVIMDITQKLAQIQKPIIQATIFVVTEAGTVGSVEVKSKNMGVLNDHTLQNLKGRVIMHFKLYDK